MSFTPDTKGGLKRIFSQKSCDTVLLRTAWQYWLIVICHVGWNVKAVWTLQTQIRIYMNLSAVCSFRKQRPHFNPWNNWMDLITSYAVMLVWTHIFFFTNKLVHYIDEDYIFMVLWLAAGVIVLVFTKECARWSASTRTWAIFKPTILFEPVFQLASSSHGYGIKQNDIRFL